MAGMAMKALSAYSDTQHFLGQINLQIDGDEATGEVYFQAYHKHATEGFDRFICGRYIDRFGARLVLVVGIAIGMAGFAMLAIAHSEPWQVIAAGVLVNVYISLAYGALPSLVVREVEPGETGVATSMNAIARTIGASTAAAIVAVLLSRAGNGHPPESSYTIIFALGAFTGLIALVLIAASKPRLRPIETVEEITDSRAMNHEWG